MWKRFLIFDMILVIGAAALAAAWMFPVKDCGISNGFSTVDQLESFLITKDVQVLDSNMVYGEEENWDNFLYAVTDEGAWLHGNHTLQIYIVEPAELYVQVGDTFEQTAWVTETLQGDSQPGEQIVIFGMGGVSVMDEQAVFLGNINKNFMMMGNQYLVFCEKTEYPRGGLAEYRTIYTQLNVLNASRDDEPFPEDFIPNYQWNQFQDRELLTYSNEEIEGFRQLKQMVFESLGIDLKKYRE